MRVSGSPPDPTPAPLPVVIEVPRGSFVKWGAEGGVDFLSPVPCPFNYGSFPGLRGADGDPLDALVLGRPLRRGRTLSCAVVGRVRFVDDGVQDDKWICLPPGRNQTPSQAELVAVRGFFSVYAAVKATWHRLRGRRGRTAVLGVDCPAPPPA